MPVKLGLCCCEATPVVDCVLRTPANFGAPGPTVPGYTQESGSWRVEDVVLPQGNVIGSGALSYDTHAPSPAMSLVADMQWSLNGVEEELWTVAVAYENESNYLGVRAYGVIVPAFPSDVFRPIVELVECNGGTVTALTPQYFFPWKSTGSMIFRLCFDGQTLKMYEDPPSTTSAENLWLTAVPSVTARNGTTHAILKPQSGTEALGLSIGAYAHFVDDPGCPDCKCDPIEFDTGNGIVQLPCTWGSSIPGMQQGLDPQLTCDYTPSLLAWDPPDGRWGGILTPSAPVAGTLRLELTWAVAFYGYTFFKDYTAPFPDFLTMQDEVLNWDGQSTNDGCDASAATAVISAQVQ